MKTIKNLTADQIRKSILQLAIQGKLVKQDPNDEPASELVKRIYEEKHKLIKEGKIKKDKNESYIYKGDDNCYYEKVGKEVRNLTDELPFAIPDSWTWVRLKNLGSLGMGQTILKNQMIEKGIPVYSATIEDKPLGFIDKNQNKINLSFGDFVIPARGASIGFVTLITCENACCTQTTMYMKLFNKIISNYLYFVFYGLKDLIFKVSGSAQPQITVSDVSEQLFPLPPINEQKRIENKIDILTRHLNTYHKIEKELTSLESSFEEKLKASILQYAIGGKLVKQDPHDEPASKLLERIKAEKEKLIKEGKIKRDKNESNIIIGDDKNYYENLPKGWVNSKLSFVINLVSGVDLSQSEYSSDNIGIPYITGASNFHNGKIIFNRYTKVKYVNSQKGDILITCKGTIGELAFNDIGDCHIARQIMAIKSFLNSEFLTYWLLSKRKQFISNGKSIIPGIDRKTILNAVIYIPPLLEEERIVFKLNLIFNKL